MVKKAEAPLVMTGATGAAEGVDVVAGVLDEPFRELFVAVRDRLRDESLVGGY